MECGVVDGIITDDSDVFLFGGSNIYKNLFNQNKMVELYTMDAIRSKMKLGRHELICLAYLVGSDYCYGIKGIGPVKALEIIEQWPGEGIEGLQDFTNWCKGIQCGQVDPSDNPKKAKLRKLATKLEFEQNFPNSQAYDAYINPQVDTSRILLDFKPPNLDRIRIFLQRSLSWEPETTDKYLLPVLKQMQKPIAAQSTIDDYYH